MNTALERCPSGASVVILRLRSLGDCVLTTPAIHLLKQHRPDLHLSVVVEPRFAPVFEGNPDIESILPPEAFAVTHEQAHLCLNFHGGTRSMVLTAASLARLRAGFGHHRYSWLYNVAIPRAQEILSVDRKVHTAEHLASAVFYLGVPQGPIPRARLFAPPAQPSPAYAVLHPFAATPQKTWSAAGFLETARHLKNEHRLEPVFIGSASDDFTPFQDFRCIAGSPLRDIMSLLSGATLFLGNDSGPAHMAAAFGLPVVVLFRTSDPVVWAPWQTAAETIVEPEGLCRVPAQMVIAALDRVRVRA
jgi:heptosyltransferase-3